LHHCPSTPRESAWCTPECVTSIVKHSFTRGVTERNMGQSLYLCFGSAGFCCWGLGMGRPFPHVKAWGGTAQITTQGHKKVPFFGSFSDIWRPQHSGGGTRWVAPLDQGKTTLMRRSLITRWGGPRSEATQLMSEVDRFLTGKSPSACGFSR